MEYLNFSFLQIIIFPYVTFNLSAFKYFPIWSDFKDTWRSVSDVNIAKCLYLMRIYKLNISILRKFEFRKNVFVDVSCIIKCDIISI